MLDLLAAAAIATAPTGAPVAGAEVNTYDLATSPNAAAAATPIRKNDPVMAGDPLPPRGTDLRPIAIDAPEFQLAIAERGPVLVVGAFGGRQKDVPGLAHVAMIWKI